MKKTMTLILVFSLLILGIAIGEVHPPSGRSPLTGSNLAAISGAGFWGCLLTAAGSAVLVAGAGALTAGTGGVFVGSVLAAGTFGVKVTREACTD